MKSNVLSSLSGLAFLCMLGCDPAAPNPRSTDDTSLLAEAPKNRPAHATERPLSFMVEDGTLLPEQKLITPGLQAGGEVKFDIVSGSARFMEGGGTTLTVPIEQGRIMLPTIKPGPVYDESFVRVTQHGMPLMADLRVRTLPPDAARALSDQFTSMPQALVASDTHYAVIDENRIPNDSSGIRAEVKRAFELPSAERPLGSSDASAAGLCVRAAWGPGWVNWGMANPAGAGYSVKPESAFNLVWARAPSQAADGLYNRWWGCGAALKVPDSCTANVAANGAIDCCCNWTMAQLGHVCQWVNPGGIGWPNCPL